MINDQVNDAVSLDHTKSQWVDLGILEDACLARPETCGEAGGAGVVFWMRISYINTNYLPSVISSRKDGSPTHFNIEYKGDLLRQAYYHITSGIVSSFLSV